MRVDWLNPEELHDALEVIRKSVTYERILRLQNYEESVDTPDSISDDMYEDYLTADRAKRLWDWLEKSIETTLDSGKTAYGTIAGGGNKL